ncbi:hypothetical protein EYF80_018724 [Liparis tanakae]|uniref:Uncharacterized protein n=1 Tax=Liparis tanakae TaxID=230148 RepID=A0A4Z2I1G1_9TELE|nr:hypothetical protein EYF80_018724 [Liparis tanakae]
MERRGQAVNSPENQSMPSEVRDGGTRCSHNRSRSCSHGTLSRELLSLKTGHIALTMRVMDKEASEAAERTAADIISESRKTRHLCR